MRLLRRVAWIAGSISAALIFFAGGVFLRLLMGPISLGPAAGYIEDSINRAVTGLVVRFNSAVLEWSRMDSRIYLTVLGTKIFDPNGRIIAQAPKANLDFDAVNLLAGNLSLKRFALVGVQLTGVRTSDGTIRLGFGLQQDDTDLLKTIREMLQSGGSTGGSLDGLSIRNARLAFRDEPTGLFVISPDTNFTLESSSSGLNASVESSIEISGIPTRIVARAALRDDGMPRRGTVEIQGLSLVGALEEQSGARLSAALRDHLQRRSGFRARRFGRAHRHQIPSRWIGLGRDGGRQDAAADGQVRRRGQL